MQIELSSSFKMTLWLVGVFTCGVGALGLWLTARSWPRLMDEEGITLRNGKRVLWRDCTRVVQVSAVAEGGGRISGRAELEFGAVKVPLVPQSVRNPGHLQGGKSLVMDRAVSVRSAQMSDAYRRD